MTILRDLLSIKSFRERKAELAVFVQRTALAEATSERDAREQRLQEFRDWAQRRERELFDELCSRTVRLREIQDVQLSVGEMRGQERSYEKGYVEAEDLRRGEESELETRRETHAVASRMKDKFVELVRQHAQEQLLEVERKEDAEMEEVAEARRDRADWDEHEQEQA